VVKAVRGDTLVSLPTGCGKTIVMALLPFVISSLHQSRKLVVVVSPLLSLINSQLALLPEDYGVQAAHLSCDIGPELRALLIQALISGQTKLLYMTAQTFITKGAQGLFQVQLSPLLRHSAVVIDEAHLAHEWTAGDRPFRVAYAQLHLHIPPQSHVVLMSGTVTCRVIEVLTTSIFPSRVWRQVTAASMDRPNIFYSCSQYPNPSNSSLVSELGRLMQLYTRDPAAFPVVQIFCRSLNELSDLYLALQEVAPPTFLPRLAKYHSNLGTEHRRRKIVRAWVATQDYSIMLCTNALMVGIDKSNVRVVILFGTPQTAETAMQMLGRAGRDGKKVIYSCASFCTA
jgi:superfamily II DNA helicase RecQ